MRSAITRRTTELGDLAMLDPPDHLVQRLGPPGMRLRRDEWAHAAGRIEGYRERWRVAPDALDEAPMSRTQAAHRQTLEFRLPEQVRAPLLELGHGMEIG